MLAESFERIHRSNLIGMGILPLQFKAGETRQTLGLDGSETFDLVGQDAPIEPGQDVRLLIHDSNGKTRELTVTCRIDTADEVQYYLSGGILNYVLRELS